MKTKEVNSFQFLVKINSQNRMTNRQRFLDFLYATFCFSVRQNNLQQISAISNLSTLLLVGIIIAASSSSFSQSTECANISTEQMSHDSAFTIRTGLYKKQKISIDHLDFSSNREAEVCFLKRKVDYIDFTLVDLNRPALASWRMIESMQTLDARATNYY